MPARAAVQCRSPRCITRGASASALIAGAKAIQRLLNKSGTAQSSREPLYYALGKIYDDCARYDDAFECYRRANEFAKAAAAYDPAMVSAATDSIIACFTRDFLARPCPGASDSKSPLFIVGMKAVFNVDVYSSFSIAWLIANLLFGLLVLLAGLWASRRFADRLRNGPFAGRLLRDLGGQNLAAARGFLKSLAEFADSGEAGRY